MKPVCISPSMSQSLISSSDVVKYLIILQILMAAGQVRLWCWTLLGKKADYLNTDFFLFVCNVKAHIRVNTQNVQQGEQETRGAGEGRKKQCGTET